MVHSLNPLLVSNHLEGLPKAGIMSVYLVTLAGSLSCTCWSPLEPPWTSWIQDMPWQRVAQRNNMLCGFVWNLTFYLNLLSASTIWCFCTDRASNGFLGIPSRTLVILMTCLLRVVSPRWWSLPLQFFHLQSFYSLEWFFSHWEKGDEKMEVNNKHSAWLPSSNQENP